MANRREEIVAREPIVVWVAAARKRGDATRPHLEWLEVSEAERPDYLTLTCTDGRRLHQATLPHYRVPMQTFGLYYVHKASGKQAVLQRIEEADRTRWVNWRRLLPAWEAAGEDLPDGIHFYEKKGASGVSIGRFLCSYGKATGNIINADLVRDLWIEGGRFDARTKPGADSPVVFREALAPVTLTALIMPLTTGC